jgi:hypothetical protein
MQEYLDQGGEAQTSLWQRRGLLNTPWCSVKSSTCSSVSDVTPAKPSQVTVSVRMDSCEMKHALAKMAFNHFIMKTASSSD